jgi:hypothetical protein
MKNPEDQKIKGDIRSILLKYWDPVGIGDNFKLSDEYDQFLPQIINLAVSGDVNVNAFYQFLYEIESNNMGIPNDIIRIERTAKVLDDYFRNNFDNN